MTFTPHIDTLLDAELDTKAAIIKRDLESDTALSSRERLGLYALASPNADLAYQQISTFFKDVELNGDGSKWDYYSYHPPEDFTVGLTGVKLLLAPNLYYSICLVRHQLVRFFIYYYVHHCTYVFIRLVPTHWPHPL